MIHFVVFFFSFQLFAKDRVEFNPERVFRCDAIVQVNGCPNGSPAGMSEALQANGLVISGNTVTLQALPPRPQKIREVINRNRTHTRSSSERPGQGQTVSTEANSDTPTENNSGNSGSPYPSFNKSSTSPASGTVPQAAYNNAGGPRKTIFGAPIVEDQPDGSDYEAKPTVERADFGAGVSAVTANKQNEVSNDDGGSKGGKFAAAGAGLPGGSTAGFDGANKRAPASTSGGNSYLDQLKNMAAGLLNKGFMGLGGKKGSRGRSALLRKGRRGKGGKNGAHPADGPAVNLAALNAQFQSQLKRGIASPMEFSGANTFLFGHLCKHYDNYARVHRIPNERSGCPKE